VRASVPANLLLLGEYAVLEEGGLGVAAAVEPRVRVSAAPLPAAGGGLTVIGSMGAGGEIRWAPGAPSEDPRAALLESVMEVCGRAGLPAAAAGAVEVDSSALFPAGRKGGYGSSAAAAVGLCWALLALAAGAPPAPAAVLEAALEAHRRAQGGRGSGYDVFASFHGGVGLFSGGARPGWEPLSLPWLEPLYLFRGERSVPTPGAIRRYREWRRSRPVEARRFLEESNRDVERFARARSRGEALGWFRRCRERGLRLGETIGVQAAVTAPGGVNPAECKAVGAGDELGLAFPELPLGSPAAGLVRVILAREGLAPEGPAAERTAWQG
jgi:phosphomevalonate kinase